MTQRSSSEWSIAILAAAVLLLVGLSVLPVASAQYDTPAFNMGDTIPVSVYIRLRRQTRGFMGLFGGGDDDDGDTRARRNPMAGASADADILEDAMLTANAMGSGKVLSLPQEADQVGVKHPNQLMRLIPPRHSPRFGMHRSARLPSEQIITRARKELEATPALEQSELALRLSVGKGLGKETTWLPLATRAEQLRTGVLAMVLPPEMLRELAARATGEEVRAGDKPAGDTVYYLSKVVLYFGFRKGVLGRVTSLRYECHYTAKQPTYLHLEYVWDEHRPFNPHKAITVCCAVSVSVACVMAAVMIGSRSSKASKQFRKRAVVVRHASD